MSKNTLLRVSLCASLLLISLASSFALGQVNQEANAQPPTLNITAFASPERVRFTAPASVVQMRLEVYDAVGRKLFDNELRGGNVLDWHLQDGQAARLPNDTYLCVVTVKNRAGRLTQRLGSVLVEPSNASVQAVAAAQLTAQQTAAIGPVEAQASVSVVQEGEAQPGAVLAHTGAEGQLVRGRGALSFRLGDLFAAKDQEQMRLTADGKLGLGVSDPQAKLDVAGLIRTSEGIVFPDGSVQTTAYVASGRTLSERSGVQRAAQGRSIAQVQEDAQSTPKSKTSPKTLAAPNLFVNEDLTVNGNIIFTPDLARDITMQNNNGGLRFYGAPTLTNSPAAAAIQFWGNNSAFPGQLYLDAGATDLGALIFRTAQTGGIIAERMRVTSGGNVGIGTMTPAAKLEVVGDLRSSALRQELTATAPNVIGGFIGTGSGGATPGNLANPGVVGATIGGGGFNGSITVGGFSYTSNNNNRVTGDFGTVGGGFNNRAGHNTSSVSFAAFATVGGGFRNIAEASHATVGGGESNSASGSGATVGGGTRNWAGSSFSTVSGGYENQAGAHATVGGGSGNIASGSISVVGGGTFNTASGWYSVVPGGFGAKASHYGELAFSTGVFASQGDAQTSIYMLRGNTNDTTPTELFLNHPGNTERITLAPDRALSFDILVVAKTPAAGNALVAGYHIRGVIKNVSGTTSFVGGTPVATVLGEDVAAWDVTVEADDTNDALVIKALGSNGVPTRWVATVRTVLVSSRNN